LSALLTSLPRKLKPTELREFRRKLSSWIESASARDDFAIIPRQQIRTEIEDLADARDQLSAGMASLSPHTRRILWEFAAPPHADGLGHDLHRGLLELDSLEDRVYAALSWIGRARDAYRRLPRGKEARIFNMHVHFMVELARIFEAFGQQPFTRSYKSSAPEFARCAFKIAALDCGAGHVDVLMKIAITRMRAHRRAG
jgi:hypothetical protein